MHRVASRYAKSLLQLAAEKGILASIHTDMVLFDQVGAASRALLTTLQSPVIHREKKLTILQNIFQGKVHSLTLRFFKLITQKHREALLPDITAAFLEQYNRYQGIQTANITTTLKLSDNLNHHFREIVKKIAPCKEVVLTQQIDPTLIGGYILQVADKRLDESLRTKLLALKQHYTIGGY